MKIAVKTKGASSEIEVSDATFGVRFNEALVHQVVVAFQAAGRAGTRAQKNRAAVRGGGRKPFGQKGGGRARAGTIRSPLWRGGGKIFPASNQDFSQKVNRKMHRGAMRAILSELVRQDRLIAVADCQLPAPKTRELLAWLASVGAGERRQSNALVVVADREEGLAAAARNLPYVDVCPVSEADPVRLVAHDRVVMTVDAVKRFEEMLK